MPLNPPLSDTVGGAAGALTPGRVPSDAAAALIALYCASGIVGRLMNAPLGAAGALIGAAFALLDFAADALATPLGACAELTPANTTASSAATRPSAATAAHSLYPFIRPS
jgi:hypothetical protein